MVSSSSSCSGLPGADRSVELGVELGQSPHAPAPRRGGRLGLGELAHRGVVTDHQRIDMRWRRGDQFARPRLGQHLGHRSQALLVLADAGLEPAQVVGRQRRGARLGGVGEPVVGAAAASSRSASVYAASALSSATSASSAHRPASAAATRASSAVARSESGPKASVSSASNAACSAVSAASASSAAAERAARVLRQLGVGLLSCLGLGELSGQLGRLLAEQGQPLALGHQLRGPGLQLVGRLVTGRLLEHCEPRLQVAYLERSQMLGGLGVVECLE